MQVQNGKVILEAELVDNRYVSVSVTDTGRGMNQEELHMATQPFGQVRNGHGGDQEGTGLGLPISVALIKSHNGKFSLESQKGKGTCARFVLKAHKSGLDQDDAEATSEALNPSQIDTTSSPTVTAH